MWTARLRLFALSLGLGGGVGWACCPPDLEWGEHGPCLGVPQPGTYEPAERTFLKMAFVEDMTIRLQYEEAGQAVEDEYEIAPNCD